MIQQSSISYECINAIGNSLKLDEMLRDVISTFLRQTDAIGGQFVSQGVNSKSIVSLGETFYIPNLTKNIDSYEIIVLAEGGFVIDTPIKEEHFLFLFKSDENLDTLGNMFSNFRTKLINSIEACRMAEQCGEMKLSLTNHITEEINKNKVNEEIMIAQSRMAIMGEMIGMIAHQWRQPITIIGMLINNTILDIEFDEIDKDKILEDLTSIDEQVHYLSKTIDDFRNFFRPNKLPQHIKVGDISRELLNILGKNFENNNISLSFEGDLDGEFYSYKNELLQVFLNILSNSKDAFLEHNIESSQIIFTINIEKDEILFSIQDNAGGIPKGIQEHIFDPYFSTKSKELGTGLGLYMSQIIIEKHLHGSIKVDSHSNKTVFYVKIPKIDIAGVNRVY
ncbi:MAG: HAMP domain-containing sensor histidine kinase [Sulfurimonas sp.]|nr:HAMP domain-containing sensor histidine kinase [Sulfurimonas sp.]